MAKTYIGGIVEHKFKLRNTEQHLSLLIQRINTRRPTMVNKINDIQKTLKFITNQHLEYWKEILTCPETSGQDNIQDQQIVLRNE